jgi:hypothetical protein
MNLEAFSGGKLTRLIQSGIMEILENISDTDTPATAKRQLVIKITFRPETNRKNIKVHIDTKVNKAPIRTEETNMFVGRDLNGEPVFYTANRQIPGQISVDLEGK